MARSERISGGAATSSDRDVRAVRDTLDPGDATARNYRYQHTYGVVLLVAAKRGLRPYVAIWCEHHEDFLAERTDGLFDAYQIKTSRPELGAWNLHDGEVSKSIGRFIDLVSEFGDQIGDLYFVSNTDFDEVTAESGNEKRRGRCPRLFLEHVRTCSTRGEIASPFDAAFDELMATCGCDADQLLAVVRRLNLVLGPSRNECDAALSNEHIAQLEECRTCTTEQVNAFRDDLVALVFRASSLQVTDPVRHLRSLPPGSEPDPALRAKRLVVADVIVYRDPAPLFIFPGEPSLQLGRGHSSEVIRQKLTAADLEDQVAYLQERARAAEFSLLEDVARRPEAYPQLLQQIEQRVHGEVPEANLRARLQAAPYGPAMLIDVQERLQRLAQDRPQDVGNHGYECLVGVAGLLTGECRVWWGPRFTMDVEAEQ